MKKVLLLLPGLALATISYCQVEIGIRVGANYNLDKTFHYNEQTIQNPLPASELYGAFPLRKRLSLAVSFEYSGKSKINYEQLYYSTAFPGTEKGTTTIEYYELNLGLQYSLATINKLEISAQALLSPVLKDQLWKNTYLQSGQTSSPYGVLNYRTSGIIAYAGLGISLNYKLTPHLILSTNGAIYWNTRLGSDNDMARTDGVYVTELYRINILAGIGYRF
ncbi:MAG: hypothetical protein H0X33_03470 [Taibaiella sp.]|nr:hypothetical protein [Taibaiella sp.]